ncbi:ankyrin repeat and SOCS box protein 1-like isoform X2 [Tachypleus tridentatus]|uniref:ankyrin repeat and SOCS box protein 1-like isoform X2 n=1 Tax=Tachypleus tridentatus TaxID=6853 RepID=UPI003FD1DBD3
MSDLTEFTVDPEDGDTRLHRAAFRGDVEHLREYLEDNTLVCEINRRVRPYGATPLRLSSTSGHLVCLQYLLQHGSNVDLADIKAQTPLFVAIKRKHLKCAQVLLEAGADPNGDAGNRCTPLYIAAQDGFLDGVKLLLRYGADTELEDRLLGYIPGLPLHTAAVYHHFACFAALLLAGAEPDLQKIKPKLPVSVIAQLSLSHAIVRHHCPEPFAHVLIECGGNIWQRDSRGYLATELNQNEGARLYLEKQLAQMPRSLKSLCRMAVRRILGRQQIQNIRDLPLPSLLKDYLEFRELLPEVDTLLIYDSTRNEI